jgi:hypothetical protein
MYMLAELIHSLLVHSSTPLTVTVRLSEVEVWLLVVCKIIPPMRADVLQIITK